MQADYINFVFKFPNFRYRGKMGWSEANYIAQLHSLTPEQPLGYLVMNQGRICYTKVELSRIFCLHFKIFVTMATGVVSAKFD